MSLRLRVADLIWLAVVIGLVAALFARERDHGMSEAEATQLRREMVEEQRLLFQEVQNRELGIVARLETVSAEIDKNQLLARNLPVELELLRQEVRALTQQMEGKR